MLLIYVQIILWFCGLCCGLKQVEGQVSRLKKISV